MKIKRKSNSQFQKGCTPWNKKNKKKYENEWMESALDIKEISDLNEGKIIRFLNILNFIMIYLIFQSIGLLLTLK